LEDRPDEGATKYLIEEEGGDAWVPTAFDQTIKTKSVDRLSPQSIVPHPN